MNITTIKNDCLTVDISAFGAELQSIKYMDEEYLWQGDDVFWEGKAPILFPICGSLKDDRYEYEGKSYSLPQHGFAQNCLFEAEKINDVCAEFTLKSNDETKKVYPFDFEFKVIYTVENDTLKVEFVVSNKGKDVMLFSVGGHEGYYCPEGIEDYIVHFGQKEIVSTHEIVGVLLGKNISVIAKDVESLPLKNEYFAIDGITFPHIKSRSFCLEQKDGNRRIKVDFDDFTNVLIWTMPDSKFLCIEPWCGLPDIVGSSFDFKEKAGLIKLDADETVKKTHYITIG